MSNLPVISPISYGPLVPYEENNPSRVSYEEFSPGVKNLALVPITNLPGKEIDTSVVLRLQKRVTQWFDCSRFASDMHSVRQHSLSDTAETSVGQGKSEHPPVTSEEEGFPNLTPPRPAKLPQRATFFALQEWEGYVTSISKSHFTANLVNLTSGAVRADEEATIPIEELSEPDQRNLKVGSVFRWAIGYQYQPAGTKARISQIVIRQLPQWTRRELDEARREANEMVKFLAGQSPSEE